MTPGNLENYLLLQMSVPPNRVITQYARKIITALYYPSNHYIYLSTSCLHPGFTESNPPDYLNEIIRQLESVTHFDKLEAPAYVPWIALLTGSLLDSDMSLSKNLKVKKY
jgi:hypothetical protein